MNKTEMTDHEFSKWLRKKDKNWKFVNMSAQTPYTQYFNSKGNLIALVIYNNQKTTREIFLK